VILFVAKLPEIEVLLYKSIGWLLVSRCRHRVALRTLMCLSMFKQSNVYA